MQRHLDAIAENLSAKPDAALVEYLRIPEKFTSPTRRIALRLLYAAGALFTAAIIVYLDRDGYSPVQIEWSRKVAWVHGEALKATLVAYAATFAPRWLERFERVADFTLGHFPDAEHGEWFACLDRHNRVIQRFKSGPRKGCFAAGRTLLRCDLELAALS